MDVTSILPLRNKNSMHRKALPMSLAAARNAVQPAKPRPVVTVTAVDMAVPSAKCILPYVLPVDRKLPFRSNPVVIGQYTAGIATDRSPAATVGKSIV